MGSSTSVRGVGRWTRDPVQPSSQGATDDLAHDGDPGQIEPYQQVGPLSQQIPHDAVLPFGDPSVSLAEHADVCLEGLPRRPIRPVEQRVDLDVGDAQLLGQAPAKRCLTRARSPRDEHASGAPGQRVRRLEEWHALTVRRWCRRFPGTPLEEMSSVIRVANSGAV